MENIRGLITGNYIYYEITDTSIIIHTIWDSCQNPDNLKSKKFAKIGLSTTGGCGFNPDFCYAPQIFFTAHAFRTKSRKNMTTLIERGFSSYIK